jgi:cell cycle related kinase
MEKYNILERLGEGAFGVVLKAKVIATGQTVALKKIRIRKSELEELPRNVLSELKSLQQLSECRNVVKLVDYFVHGSSLVIVLEFMQTDLSKVLKRTQKPLQESHIKSFLRMVLKGVVYCHSNNIMHRDIKPANMLISPSGELKLGDFGLATVYVGPHKPYSHQVATRWYRSPELLYGSQTYDHKVDIWAIGCIFAEMLNHCPLFPGENDIDQLHRVLKILGTPSEENWPGVSSLPDFKKITFPDIKKIELRELIPNASNIALDLLQSLLCFDSNKRFSATQALAHDYFYTHPLPVHFSELEIDFPVKEKVADYSNLNDPFILSTNV